MNRYLNGPSFKWIIQNYTFYFSESNFFSNSILVFSTIERAGYLFILSNELGFISEYRLQLSGAFTVYIYWIKGLLKNKSKWFTLSITFPCKPSLNLNLSLILNLKLNLNLRLKLNLNFNFSLKVKFEFMFEAKIEF